MQGDPRSQHFLCNTLQARKARPSSLEGEPEEGACDDAALLCQVVCGFVLVEGAVHLSDDLAFEGSEGFSCCVSLAASAFDVCNGLVVVRKLGPDRCFECSVHDTVPATVVAVVCPFPRGRIERGRCSPHGELRFGREPCDVANLGEDRCGTEGAYTVDLFTECLSW